MIDLIVEQLIEDMGFGVMSAIAIASSIRLHYEKKANRNLVEIERAILEDSLKTETKYNKVIFVVTDFINEHNSCHDRKIRFYYHQDGWHCCYADEMPQGDTFTEQEEISPLNEKDNENK